MPAAARPQSAADLERRLRRLEASVERLLAAQQGQGGGGDRPLTLVGDDGDGNGDSTRDRAPTSEGEDPFFALHALQRRFPSPGAVLYTGSVDLPIGHLEYQWGRPTDALLQADWAERAERIAALGHPLRLAMLRLLLEGEHTVAQLVDELDLGSTGVAYHHLNQLQTAGWITSPHRGAWALTPSRVVGLLAIVTALEES